MSGKEEGYIPKTLDMPERWLIWDMDQFVIALLFVGFGATTGLLFPGILAGAALAWQYGRFKSGKHPKFLVHAMYWWLPSKLVVKTKSLPSSDIRHFIG